jgi:hypothetical protein
VEKGNGELARHTYSNFLGMIGLSRIVGSQPMKMQFRKTNYIFGVILDRFIIG